MKTQRINHYSVWTSIVINQLISILWYSPLLFANKWMNLLGKNFDDFKGESTSGLIFSIIGSITFNYFLAWLFKQLQIENALKGLAIAFALALCCFSFQTFTQDNFSLRPNELSLINSGNIILNFCFSGLLLGGWKKNTI